MSFVIESVNLSLGGGTLDVTVLNDEATMVELGETSTYGISIEQLKTAIETHTESANVPELFIKTLKDIRNLGE